MSDEIGGMNREIHVPLEIQYSGLGATANCFATKNAPLPCCEIDFARGSPHRARSRLRDLLG